MPVARMLATRRAANISQGGPHDRPLDNARRVTHAEMRTALAACPPGTHLRAVLAAVMLHVGHDGEPCSAGTATLGNIAGCDARSCRRSLQQLVAVGVLTAEVRAGATTLYSPVIRKLYTPGADDPPTPVVDDPRPRATPRASAAATPGADDPRRVRREEPPTGGSKGQENGSLFSEPEKRRPRERAKLAPPNAELFEALASAAGWKIDQMTATQRARTGRVAKELSAVGATPDEIAGQALAMELAWGSPPAPWTVASHWGSAIGRKPRRASAWTPREDPA